MDKVWLKNYEKGVPSEINPHEYSSVLDIFETSFKNFADRPAFHCMGKTLSYKQIDEMSLAFGSYLQNNLGLKKGDRLAIMSPNILQYPIALFGALRAGLIVVNCNPLYTPRELEFQLKDSGSIAIVIVDNFAHVLEKVIAKTSIQHVITTQLGDLLGFPKSAIVNFVVKKIKKMVPSFSLPKAVTFKRALALGSQSQFKKVEINNQNTAFLQYTGGTTGVSKGAILTHGNIVANMVQARAWISNVVSAGEEIIITPLPLYHIFSLTANCFVFSSVGALNVLITNPKDIPGFIKEIKKWKFTAFTGVNTLFNALVNNPSFKEVDFSKLKLTLGGGMAVQKVVAEKWKSITKKPIIEAYGLTETSPAACINPLTIPEFNGFIGVPLPSTEIVIKDNDGNNLKQGDVGELCIRGPQVMKGYHNRQDETDKVMTKDGFFRTGDLGLMTEDGFFKLVDRKKDMILVSGFNVYPNEVEEVMSTHPKILECAAVGVEDESSGEVVKLFVVKRDESLTKEEVVDFARKGLTNYKVPKLVEFRSDLPKTNVGKILRRELRDSQSKA